MMSLLRVTEFPEANVMVAENQDEYETLPAFYDKSRDEGIVVSCYKLTLLQRLILLFSAEFGTSRCRSMIRYNR